MNPPSSKSNASAAKPPPGPLQRLLAALLGLLQSHVGIFSIELEEVRERLIKTLVLAIVGAGCLLLCLLTVTLAVLLMVDEANRLYASIGLFVVFAAVGAMCLRVAWSGMKDGPQPFSGTVDELRRDRERLLP